jgi:NAD(P)-dependent dehydrogenase (short-subunit alcohol dehydrogenase family)
MAAARRFEGRIAVVTGSSRGLGRALALRLADEGATVIVNSSVTAVDGAHVAAEINQAGGRALYVRADMACEADIEALAQLIETRFGRVEIVIHNAAGGRSSAVTQTTWEDFERALRTNTYALIALARSLAHLMGEAGKLLYISSFGAIRAVPGYGAVGASKAASEAIVRSLAMELAPRIQANILRPFVFPTVSLRAFSVAEGLLEMAASQSPLGLPRIEDIVGAALFLCSRDADYITGQTLDVDGGMSTSALPAPTMGAPAPTTGAPTPTTGALPSPTTNGSDGAGLIAHG